jgi:hypothetical protein
MLARRELILHPRRGPTGLVFFLGGLFFIAMSAMRAELDGGLWAGVVPGLLCVAVAVHLWLTRLELRAFDDGRFTITRREWPLKVVVITGRLQEVSAVREVGDDGTSSLTLQVGAQELPLLASATSDSHRRAAQQLRDFFELPEQE